MGTKYPRQSVALRKVCNELGNNILVYVQILIHILYYLIDLV